MLRNGSFSNHRPTIAAKPNFWTSQIFASSTVVAAFSCPSTTFVLSAGIVSGHAMGVAAAPIDCMNAT